MSGGFFRGTSADQDTRFSNKQAKLLKSQKFSPELDHLVDMTKVKMDVLRPWIATRATELIGFEDEVLINFIYGLLDAKEVDGKQIQIQLTGFMEKHTSKFMKELWGLLLSAQKNASGVPQQFLDAKEEELRKKNMETDRINQEIQRKKEKTVTDLEAEKKNWMEAVADKSRSTNAAIDSISKHRSPDVSINHAEDGNPVEEKDDLKEKRRSLSVRSSSRSPSRLKRGHLKSSLSPSSRSRSPSVSPRPRQKPPQRRFVSSLSLHSPLRSPSPRRRSPLTQRESQYRSPSPKHQRSPYPRQTSPSPSRYRSPSSRHRYSPSRHRSSGQFYRRSISPPWRRSRRPSPPRQRSPSPYRRNSPTRRSPSPCRYRSPPRRQRSPSPRRRRSPITTRRRSQSPWRGRSPSPKMKTSFRHSISPKRHGSPSPRRTSLNLRSFKYDKRSASPPSRNQISASQLAGRLENRSRSPVRHRSPPKRSADIIQHDNGSKSNRMQSHRISEKEFPTDIVSKKDTVRVPVAQLPPSSPLSSKHDSGEPSPSRFDSPSPEPKKIPRINRSRSLSGSPVRRQLHEKYRRNSPERRRRDDVGDGRAQLRELDICKTNTKLPGVSHSTERELRQKTQKESAVREGHQRWRGSPPSEGMEYGPGVVGEDVTDGGYQVRKKSRDFDSLDALENDQKSKKNASKRKQFEVDAISDSDEAADATRDENMEKPRRRTKSSSKRSVSDNEGRSSGSEPDDRKESKRRRKEEKRLRKEERRRRRKERHQRKLERSGGEKAKIRSVDTVTPPSYPESETIRDSEMEGFETEQKKLEIELRNKALESLRAKKGFH